MTFRENGLGMYCVLSSLGGMTLIPAIRVVVEESVEEFLRKHSLQLASMLVDAV